MERTPTATRSRRRLLRRYGGALGGTVAALLAARRAQAEAFGEREAAHLLRRAGFGGTPEEVAALAARGREGAVNFLVDYEAVPNDAMEEALAALVQDVPRGERAEPGRIDLNTLRGIQAWWLYRMWRTARPLEEKLTLFWHGHFATAISKVNRADLMLEQNRTLRRLALGNFRELLVEVSRDPAMIIWLDNFTNVKGAPNENYARELLELFSLGIEHVLSGEPNYTERDVQEIARAFTGWTLRRGRFFFNRRQHDDGLKTVFGHTGPFNGEDVIDLIVEREAAALFLAKKLWESFAYEDPEPAILEELAQVYFDAGYEMKAVVRRLFTLDAFYGERARFAAIKSPAEFVVGTLRMLESELRDARPLMFLASLMATMDQELFNPPTVKGWDGGLAWINTSTLLVRYNAANLITSLREGRVGVPFDPAKFVRGPDQTPEAVVDLFLRQLGRLEVSEATRAFLVTYLSDGDPEGFVLDARTREIKVRGLVHLILSLPQYQLN